MELAALAAGVDAFGQLARIDAGEHRAQAARDHVARELAGGEVPERKERLDAGAQELLLAGA